MWWAEMIFFGGLLPDRCGPGIGAGFGEVLSEPLIACFCIKKGGPLKINPFWKDFDD